MRGGFGGKRKKPERISAGSMGSERAVGEPGAFGAPAGRAFLFGPARHDWCVKLALHRSVTFWSGVLVMLFAGWAWWDSIRFATSAGRGTPALYVQALHYHSGIDLRFTTSGPGVGSRYLDREPSDLLGPDVVENYRGNAVLLPALEFRSRSHPPITSARRYCLIGAFCSPLRYLGRPCCSGGRGGGSGRIFGWRDRLESLVLSTSTRTCS